MKKVLLFLLFLLSLNVQSQTDEFGEYGEKKFNIRPFTGIDYASFVYQYMLDGSTIIKQYSMPFNFGARIGCDFEYIFQNSTSWYLSLQPSFLYYNAKASQPYSETDSNLEYMHLDYKALELAIMPRYYRSINDHSRIFFNGGFVVAYPFKSTIQTYHDSPHVNTKKLSYSLNIATGIGYNYEKINIEARWNFKRNILINHAGWNSNLKIFSLIVSYKVF